MKTISFLIAADLVPTESNFDLFMSGNIDALIGPDLKKVLEDADFRIFNLETPLTDEVKPITKCGPNLIAPTETINGIKALNPTLFGLANNHILDQGEQGLFSTIKVLKNANIAFLGAGANLEQASRPYVIERESVRIGIYACTEHEFSIATENSSGTNPFDPLESLDHIHALKAECDFVIVLYHGGKEHYRYPSPYLQKVCRKIVQKGADLVICQHSHCIGCFEEYEGSTIIYGQGNFIFDYDDSEFWQTSLLLKVFISDKLSVEFIPICKKDNHISLANAEEKEDVLNLFFERSRQIISPDFVANEYRKFCADNGENYLRAFSGFGRVVKKIDRFLKGKFIKTWYDQKQLVVLRNFIECEAHRELLLRYLRKD